MSESPYAPTLEIKTGKSGEEDYEPFKIFVNILWTVLSLPLVIFLALLILGAFLEFVKIENELLDAFLTFAVLSAGLMFPLAIALGFCRLSGFRDYRTFIKITFFCALFLLVAMGFLAAMVG